MVSGRANAIVAVKTEVANIPYSWGDIAIAQNNPNQLFQKVAMWNDQVNREKAGTGYTFAKPACFIEVVTQSSIQFMGNVTCDDLLWRLHIIDRQLDSGDGQLDENLTVITYRDLAKSKLTRFQAPQCSSLFYVDEKPDYSHTDVYHLVLEFKNCFTDLKGSKLDPDQTIVTYKEPPTGLELIPEFVANIDE